jgi:hypothetical protein
MGLPEMDRLTLRGHGRFAIKRRLVEILGLWRIGHMGC